MMFSRLFLTLFLMVALFAPNLLRAGTLDDAPFRVVVPSTEWQIDDTTARPMGRDVYLVATISNTNSLLKSVVIKTILAKVTDSSLDELCAGINDAFANPALKKISEADATFLGYKARTFAYEVTQGGQTTYNVAIVFMADGRGWTIAFVGRANQKDEINTMAGFYQKKAG
jgi:hypothetical protein